MQRFAGLALCFALVQALPAAGDAVKLVTRDGSVQPDELRLHFSLPPGMNWPAGCSLVYPDEMRDKAQLSWQPMNRHEGQPNPYSAHVRSVGPGEFAVRLPAYLTQPFYVAVCAGLFTVFRGGTIPDFPD